MYVFSRFQVVRFVLYDTFFLYRVWLVGLVSVSGLAGNGSITLVSGMLVRMILYRSCICSLVSRPPIDIIVYDGLASSSIGRHDS